MAWNDNLEGNPLAIASANDHVIRVMAGPGSGKTFALMRRIARLLEEGINPARILLLTFTRTAASDLVKSINDLNIQGAEQIVAGTLHSFCFSLLHKEQVLPLTNRFPRPLLNFEIDMLLDDLAHLRGIGKRQVNKLLHGYEAAWARLQHEQPGYAPTAEDQQFEQDILNYLHFLNAILIGELVPVALRYLRENPHCEELEAYDYVFVDEYQDLNKAEQSLIDLLAANARLMVIGDEDQSIYQSFRHANPEGIRLFNQTHHNTVDYDLNECRRCPQQVVRIADNFIQNNQNRADRHLLPRQANIEGSIVSVQWSDMDEEAEGLSDYIKHRVDEGLNPGQILILCPRRQFGYKMKEALLGNGIEAHSFFQEQLLDELEAQKAFTLLMLYCNQQDGVSWRSVIGFGDNPWCAGYLNIKKYCEEHNEKLWDVLEKISKGEIKVAYTNNIILNYREFKNRLGELKALNPKQVIESVFPAGKEWSDAFRELIGEIQDDVDCNDIRDMIRSNITQPELPAHPDFVRIMSLHKSKGLTAKLVIVCGFIESLLPVRREEWTVEEKAMYIEEQRRLVYVALTRPTEELIISSIFFLPKKDAFKMGAKVQPIGKYKTRSIASSFATEFGEGFPRTVKGKDWLEHILNG